MYQSRHRVVGVIVAAATLFEANVFGAPPADRYAVSELPVVYLDQNWSPDDSVKFYSLRQGSPLIRKQFFDNLEQPESQERFADQAYLAKFGFLRQKHHDRNQNGYPVGFTSGGGAVQINCAACHTSKLVYNGKEYRIDGSQAMIDVESWLNELIRALRLTTADAPNAAVWETLSPNDPLPLDQNTKFGRFARKILGSPNPKASHVYAVIDALKADLARRQRYNDYNDFGKVAASDAERATLEKHASYGFGRIDALGAILNQATAEALDLPKNARTANAPVNFPAIWDAPQHTRVQWNGSVENEGFGALGRNVGQVVGVFGLLNVKSPGIGGYDSSVNVDALEEAEELVTKLWSPKWPAEFGANETLVETGRVVYQNSCVDCHAIMDRDDPARQPNDQLTPIDDPVDSYPALGTDRQTASNWSRRRAEIGVLAGRYRSFPLGDRFGDNPTDSVPARDILAHVVFNVITRQFVPWNDELTLDDVQHEQFLLGAGVSSDELLRYKSRPLNGVWSTAPYLHNGSVISIVDLLKPANERAVTFHVGSTDYEPATLGYKDAGPFVFNTQIKGNSNAGHEYGVALSPGEKQALIEFLKTL
jgi:mono/diheme cytochrome c family protein